MGWFSVTSVIRSTNGSNVQFAFRTHEANDLEEFAACLAKDGVIVGDRFKVLSNDNVLEGPKQALLMSAGIALVHDFPGAERYRIVERFERGERPRNGGR